MPALLSRSPGCDATVEAVHLRIRLGGEHYALALEHVLEVLAFSELTPVPGSPPTVLGLHNLRGEILASLDLSAVLSIAGAGEPRHLVVVADGARRAGLAVDELFDLAALPEASATTDSPFLLGGALIEGTLVGIVDVPAVLDSVAGSPAAEIA
jgi:purine-binding chemotaxis protein CheW